MTSAVIGPVELDPCEGGAGLGIEIIADPERDGKPRRITLVVEGLEAAAVCSGYTGSDVTVIGLAGREAWRRDGLPVPELRAVVGTDVTIVLGPEVRTHLDAYNSGLAASEACMGKGAKTARFSQPPGASGVTVAKWLDSLTEDEKPAAVAWLLETTTDKPAPNKKDLIKTRGALGVDSTTGLDLHDTAIGTLWGDAVLDRFRYLDQESQWLGYQSGRWARSSTSEVGSSIMRYIDMHIEPIKAARKEAAAEGDGDACKDLTDTLTALYSSNKRAAVRSAAADYGSMHVRRDQLDQHPRLWCAANKVINLDTGEVLDHDPELLLTAGSDVPYDPEATCRRFDAFLADVLPETDVRDYVMRLLFLAMYGEVIEHVFPAFIGEGGNGKGTLIRIVEKAFGAAFAPVNASSLLERKFEKHEEEIAQLAGKRLVVCQEPTKGARWDAERIKSWTGGDTLTGRPMHGHRFSFAPSHTLIMVTNNRPVVDGDAAFWRRYREIPFNVSVIGREDPTLEPEIIAKELPGVLNRLLEAGRVYRALGRLSEPAAVVVATEGARIESEPLTRFATECVEVTNERSDQITNAELYRRVTDWWRENELPQSTLPRIKGTFGKEMRRALGFAPTAKNPIKVKTRVDATENVTLTWTGIQWGEAVAELTDQPPDQLGNRDIIPLPRQPRSVANPNSAVAEFHDRVAEWLPSSGDQGVDVSAGENGAVAEVAEVAEFELHIEPRAEEDTENRVDQGVEGRATPYRGVQKEQLGNLGNSATVSSANDRPRNGSASPPSNGAEPAAACPHCTRDIPTRVIELHIPKCSKNPAREVS